MNIIIQNIQCIGYEKKCQAKQLPDTVQTAKAQPSMHRLCRRRYLLIEDRTGKRVNKMKVYSVDKKTQEKMLSWGRYLFWAEILCQRFKDFIDSPHDIENSVDSWTFFALMSQWYASLWVVIEGWQKLGFDDHAINDLIQQRSVFCDLMKRYRNGVFHYQPRMIEERFLAFLREGD
ncbi:MAG TPA: hypothetical protein VMU21_04520 [Thermodesulfovibrionales bacterium]|nr:hypothetical protein [Thermodesulfovibrionales bacterium]